MITKFSSHFIGDMHLKGKTLSELGEDTALVRTCD